MSVWAQAWAYEQRLGKWRKNKKGEETWKGDSGAKSVLAAAATFADEEGYCFAGQETLAAMCDMTARTVREHLYNLEHAYGKIRRKHRKKDDGTYTSDGMWLLAPRHRLRPPREGDEAQSPPTENFSVGEKRAHQRKSFPNPAEEFSGEPSDDPSGDPSEEGGLAPLSEEPLPDDETGRCLLFLKKVKGIGKNFGELAVLVAELREEFPNADPVEVCRDYEFNHRVGKERTKIHASKLRNYFRTANNSRRNGRDTRSKPPPREKPKIPTGFGRMVSDEEAGL